MCGPYDTSKRALEAPFETAAKKEDSRIKTTTLLASSVFALLAIGWTSSSFAEHVGMEEYVYPVKPPTDLDEPRFVTVNSSARSFGVWSGPSTPADRTPREPTLFTIRLCRMMYPAGGTNTILGGPLALGPEALTTACLDMTRFCTTTKARKLTASGGAHSIAYGLIVDVADTICKTKFALVGFDANIDFGKRGLGLRFVLSEHDR